nr:uncharacterized protein LOC109171395 [Ipomoea batatas]
MGGENGWGKWAAPPPTGAAPMYATAAKEEHWTHFDSSVNAVSFGFVATAILISMFLVMAIFERFLRPTSPESPPPPPSSGRRIPGDIESQMAFHPKLCHPTPKIVTSDQEFSVLMPGEEMPTFIAHLAPISCPPNRDPRLPSERNEDPTPRLSTVHTTPLSTID